MREALLYRQLKDSTVQCELCYRRCTIPEGKRGYCLSRLNRDGTLYSLIYGMISAIEATPIEDKPFIRFQPGTKCLSIGTFGCNFRCKGCQNHEISWGTEVLDGLAECAMSLASTDANLDECVTGDFDYMSPQDVIDEAERLGCEGVAFTYNEPTIWLEFVLDTARLAKERGLYTVYVTNSWLQPKHVDVIGPYIDAMALDIKSLHDDYYSELCNVENAVEGVLKTCEYAAKHYGIHIETRTCIVTGYNDNMQMLGGIAAWIRDHLGRNSVWHVLQYLPKHQLQSVPKTSKAVLEAARMEGIRAGLEVVHVVEGKGCD